VTELGEGRFGRRRFLAGSSAGVGALAGFPAYARRAVAAPAPDLDYSSWSAVRAAFPLTRHALHFTSFLLSPHPRPVAAAIETYRRGIDLEPEGYLAEHHSAREQRVLKAASAYTGGRPGEIALTDSTTMGLGLVYAGLHLSPGDEIVTSTHDFYSTHEALRLRARRSGARVRKIALYRSLARSPSTRWSRPSRRPWRRRRGCSGSPGCTRARA